MKLLLTSGWLTNDSIVKALFSLTWKKPEDTTIVFVPTASNVEQWDKSWLINDLVNLKKQNFKSIEITDISAVDESIWKSSFKRADVLFFEWWNTYHLMRCLNKVWLNKSITEFLENKVYVGVSAGSMITNPDLNLKLSQEIYEEDTLETEEMKGLNLVNFYFLPHLNSRLSKKIRKENIEKLAKNINIPIYALDDNSALKIDNGKIEVISEGEWFILNDNK